MCQKHPLTGIIFLRRSNTKTGVPACGKCNQSKGNKPWRDWMRSKARLSPGGRGIPDLEARIAKLDAFERWRKPTLVNFVAILGEETWEHYWSLCEAVVGDLRKHQETADKLRDLIAKSLHP